MKITIKIFCPVLFFCWMWCAGALPCQAQVISIGIMPFQDESDAKAPAELLQKIRMELQQKLTLTYKDVLARLIWSQGRLWLADAPVKRLARFGKEQGVKFVLRGGILAVGSGRKGPDFQCHLELFSELVDTDNASVSSLRAEGWGTESNSASEDTRRWDSYTWGSPDFAKSAIGQALNAAVGGLMEQVHANVISSSPQAPAEPEPIQTQQPVETVAPPPSCQNQTDQELQQLITQAESLISSGASAGQDTTLLQQCLEKLLPAMKMKLEMMQQGQNTAGIDKDISYWKLKLQDLVKTYTQQSATNPPQQAGDLLPSGGNADQELQQLITQAESLISSGASAGLDIIPLRQCLAKSAAAMKLKFNMMQQGKDTATVEHDISQIKRELEDLVKTYAQLVAINPLQQGKPSVLPHDISPNMANGSTGANNSETGVICELAGSEAMLYAVSLNAGVWLSLNGGAWTQLPQSPHYASVIAIDPANPAHVVVGERAGEASDPRLNRTGVWESFDKGDTWRLIYCPAALGKNLQEQAIADVVFTPTGTLLIGTSEGIGRRSVGSACPGLSVNCFDFISSAVDVQSLAGRGGTPMTVNVRDVTAFAFSGGPSSSRLVIWALGRRNVAGEVGQLMFSDDDGLTWKAKNIFKNVDGYEVGFDRGDRYTLAAIGNIAIISFIPKNREEVQVTYKPTDKSDNWVALLYYSRALDRYYVQALKSPFRGNGRGKGGRARLQVFSKDNSYTPSLGNIDIFYSFGQDVLVANAFDGGILRWTPIAATCASEAISKTPGLGYKNATDNIHCDIWDVHLDFPHHNVRLATDGGIFKRIKDEKGGWKWVTHNDELHTHHVHNIFVATRRQNKVPHLVYPTIDNDTWYYSPGVGPDWHSLSITGDADYVLGDQAVSNVALVMERGDLTYIDFGQGKPLGASFTPGKIFLHGVTPLNFQVIQTLEKELPCPLLDVVMLVPAPVRLLPKSQGGQMATIESTTGGPILIRNSQFLFLPAPTSYHIYQRTWDLVSDDVPAGTRAVWVSNGHVNPVYYIETIVDNVCDIYRMDCSDHPHTWHKLKNIGGTIHNTLNKFWDPTGPILIGPLYVNPYDPDQVFVLTDKGVMCSPLGKKITEDTVFEPDDVLTAILTQSGTYDFQDCYGGGELPSGSYESNRAASRYVLAQMAFNREHPHHVLVGSPVSGLFVATEKNSWLNLTEFLPRPYAMIAGVAIEGQTAYAALEGRGLWRFTHYQNGRKACYFTEAPTGNQSAMYIAVCSLLKSDKTPLSSKPVHVILVDNVANNVVESWFQVNTDANGMIRIPINTRGKVVHISFDGDNDYAPCRVSLVCR